MARTNKRTRKASNVTSVRQNAPSARTKTAIPKAELDLRWAYRVERRALKAQVQLDNAETDEQRAHAQRMLDKQCALLPEADRIIRAAQAKRAG